jgi:hypothetical protein
MPVIVFELAKCMSAQILFQAKGAHILLNEYTKNIE